MSRSSYEDRAFTALALMVGVLALIAIVLGITGLVVLFIGP